MSLNDWKPSLFAGVTLEDISPEEKPAPINPDGPVPPLSELDGVTLPAKQEDKQPAVINVDMEAGATAPTSMNQDEIDEIPNWDVTIRLMDEKATKLVEMKKVQEDILGSAQMSYGSAESIDATFENFFSSSNPKGQYTKSESKIGLEYAKRFMAGKIKLTQESLEQEVVTYSEIQAPKLLEGINVLKSEKADKLYLDVQENTDKLQEYSAKLEGALLVLPFKNQAFVNILKDDIADLNIEDMSPDVPLPDTFRVEFTKLQSLWKNSEELRWTVTNLVNMSLSSAESNGKVFSDETCDAPPADVLILGYFLPLYASAFSTLVHDEVVKITTELGEDAEKAIDCLANKENEAFNDSGIIKSRTQQMNQIASGVIDVEARVDKFCEFNSAICSVFGYLAALVK